MKKIPFTEIILISIGLLSLFSKQGSTLVSWILIIAGIIIYLAKRVNLLFIKEEEKESPLDIINEIYKKIDKNLIVSGDLLSYCGPGLDKKGINELSGSIIIPLINISVAEFEERVSKHLLSEDEIIKILENGTKNCLENFFYHYALRDEYKIPDFILQIILQKEPFFIYRFIHLRSSTLIKFVPELPIGVLLGYCFVENQQDGISSIENYLQKDGKNSDIFYSKDAEEDMIIFLDENYPDEFNLRSQIFERFILEGCNLVRFLKNVKKISVSEMAKIFFRNNDDEIFVLLERVSIDGKYILDKPFSFGDIKLSAPLHWVVRMALDLTPIDGDFVRNNYDFPRDKSLYFNVIDLLTPDELTGNNINYGIGDYDFISLLGSFIIDEDKEIRAYAFKKMISSDYFKDCLDEWSDVLDIEVEQILQSANVDLLECVFARDDAEDIIARLSDSFIIKYRLGLMNFGDNYMFNQEFEYRLILDDFRAKIEKLLIN